MACSSACRETRCPWHIGFVQAPVIGSRSASGWDSIAGQMHSSCDASVPVPSHPPTAERPAKSLACREALVQQRIADFLLSNRRASPVCRCSRTAGERDTGRHSYITEPQFFIRRSKIVCRHLRLVPYGTSVRSVCRATAGMWCRAPTPRRSTPSGMCSRSLQHGP